MSKEIVSPKSKLCIEIRLYDMQQISRLVREASNNHYCIVPKEVPLSEMHYAYLKDKLDKLRVILSSYDFKV